MAGYVFDIQRFALHDGNGIRTTIFLKGCPLRCKWCQNPEGLEPIPQVLYMKNTCIHCGRCVQACKMKGIEMLHDELQVHREVKEDWEKVIDQCPSEALRYDCTLYTAEDVVKEARKDIVFFRNGGGVTISGGEPFYQFDFLLEILQLLKEQQIHTTIETSLYTSKEKLVAILPYVDHMYVDMKLYDKEEHQTYTGVDNSLIKENIQWLLRNAKDTQVTVRTPIIPKVTATKENIMAIATFLSTIDASCAYELLNYNPLAKAKYEMTGKAYFVEDNYKLYTTEEMDTFCEYAKAGGIHNMIKN